MFKLLFKLLSFFITDCHRISNADDLLPHHIHIPLYLGHFRGLLISVYCPVSSLWWWRAHYIWWLPWGLLLATTQHWWGMMGIDWKQDTWLFPWLLQFNFNFNFVSLNISTNRKSPIHNMMLDDITRDRTCSPQNCARSCVIYSLTEILVSEKRSYFCHNLCILWKV